MRHFGTSYKFAHHHTVDGERCLVWGNDIGELLIPVRSPEYIEALNDRGWEDNALVNEGEQELLETYFRAQAKKATLYGRLYMTGSIAESATLASPGATEVSGTGYSPTSQCAWTVGNTDFGATATGEPTTTLSSTKTFLAGGTWTAAAQLVLATSGNSAGTPDNTGKLVAWVALSTSRTLVNTDTLDVSVSVGLS